MGKPVIFVIGANGRIGVAAMRYLSERHGEHFSLTAGTRKPDEAEALKKLENVRVVQAEMGGEGLESVFSGVDALFIVSPSTEDVGTRVGNTAAAAKSAGVNFVLVLSATTVGQVDCIFGAQRQEVEENVRQTGVKFCFLRLTNFYENFLYFGQIKEKSCFDDPVDGDKPMAMLSCDDIGKAAAAILTCWSKHVNQTYAITSAKITYNELAAEMSAVLGKTVKYERKSYEDHRKMMLSMHFPVWAADGLLQIFRLVDAQEACVTTFDPSVLESITGEKPTTVKEFLEKNISSFQ